MSEMRGPTASLVPYVHRFVAAVLAIVAVPVVLPGPVQATPPAPQFGPVIEDYAEYEGQRRCRPKPKPGVVAFQEVLSAAYPEQTTWFNISRPCKDGGQSEHKEGRALDWAVTASDPADRAAVQDLFAWMFATDEHGNTHAMARRLGVMYVIWNRRMWSAWDPGWEVFCVQRGKRCKDPDSKAVLHPHNDHVHFSFGWPGARMQTSYWLPDLSRP